MIQKIYELRDVCEQTGQLCKINKKTHEIEITKNKYHKKQSKGPKYSEKEEWVVKLKELGKWEPIEVLEKLFSI